MYQGKEIRYKENSEGCHICTSHRIGRFGYPVLVRSGIQQNLARYLWIQKYGVLDKKILACHTCDNRKCINLNHIFIGTQNDNLKDAARKKRMAHGANHYNTKLKAEDVLFIRNKNKWNKGDRIKLAEKFKVTPQYISQLKNGKGWL